MQVNILTGGLSVPCTPALNENGSLQRQPITTEKHVVNVKRNYMSPHVLVFKLKLFRVLLQGDSGSPLFCQRNGQWSLLGLGGWSVAQCIDMYFFFPSVYTDLSIFRDWIIAVMHGTD